MSGSFRVVESDCLLDHRKHDHIVFYLKCNGVRHFIIYNDPRRFGFLLIDKTDHLSQHPMLKKLGVEPMANSFNGCYLAEHFLNKKTSLKNALLDQSIIAGLGNIYVCEALWRSSLSPKRLAGTLVNKSAGPSKACLRLVASIRDVIVEAINAGGSSIQNHRKADGGLGYFQHQFSVYDRQGLDCMRQGCKGAINRIVQSGRASFYCTKCGK